MADRTIIFDHDKCIGCYACVIACKLQHNDPPHPPRPPEAEPKGINRITIYQHGPLIRDDRVIQFFQPLACLHCAGAPCIEACPSVAIYRDPDTGVVLVDQEKCSGCKSCLSACPYDVPQFDEREKMVKCDMCIDRLKAGQRTACEATCVARAIVVGRTEDILNPAKKTVVKVK